MGKKNINFFWKNNTQYYEHIKNGSENILDNVQMRRLSMLLTGKKKVLDVGSGEGSKANSYKLLNPSLNLFGIDISDKGVAMANKNYPSIDFRLGNIEKLPFDDESFDLCYSLFVFEHTVNPQKILDEMIRVCKTGGKVVIICPNFGSPIYPSPVTPRLNHLLRALKREFVETFFKPKKINWFIETPKLDVPWQPDFDTTISPYVRTLKHLYPNSKIDSGWKGHNISSNWKFKLLASPFKFFGLLNFPFFKNWGPYLYFELTKK